MLAVYALKFSSREMGTQMFCLLTGAELHSVTIHAAMRLHGLVQEFPQNCINHSNSASLLLFSVVSGWRFGDPIDGSWVQNPDLCSLKFRVVGGCTFFPFFKKTLNHQRGFSQKCLPVRKLVTGSSEQREWLAQTWKEICEGQSSSNPTNILSEPGEWQWDMAKITLPQDTSCYWYKALFKTFQGLLTCALHMAGALESQNKLQNNFHAT